MQHDAIKEELLAHLHLIPFGHLFSGQSIRSSSRPELIWISRKYLDLSSLENSGPDMMVIADKYIRGAWGI